MRHRGNDMREKQWHLNYDMDVFLRTAAYRATHGGLNPPLNSQLWMEYVRLWEDSHRPRRLWRWLGWQGRREPEWRDAPPLERFSVVKPFLSDDYTLNQVMARLETWPMIKEGHLADRDPSGEWFLMAIEVLAESRRAAAQIVECIFMLEPSVPNPEVG